jgi:quercetin dioxygenase-like cupin family protein
MITTHVNSAEVLLGCSNLESSLAFFVEQLGFRVDLIFPADAPTTASISAYGVRLRLEVATVATPITLRLEIKSAEAKHPSPLIGPDGVRVQFAYATPTLRLPMGTQEWVLSRGDDLAAWGTGRAGMHYRDLIPGRLGGRFVASHIRIPQGGEVPDYVHFHRVRFQMIYCKAGWVRVVYEDQGEPFVMQAGDCVLQPPQIRHRVLEASAGLEVIELGCPAIHDTVADHELTLPNGTINTQRDFSGQRFVRHVAANATWQVSGTANVETCDIGIAAATANLARVQTLRSIQPTNITRTSHTNELAFFFLLAGTLNVSVDGFGEHQINEGDSFVVPAGAAHRFTMNINTKVLEVVI